jgi:CO/xanthine dehydrogenase Mo-binding subunit
MFHIPFANIKVYAPYLGGGFGGKSDVSIEPMVAYIARFVPNHPVRLVLTRKEAFTSSLLGRGMRGKIKVGAKNDGKLVALKAEFFYSDGAFGDTACNVVTATGFVATGPYEYEHCEVDSYGIYTNTPPVGAYRGYGHPGSAPDERKNDQYSGPEAEYFPGRVNEEKLFSPMERLMPSDR